MSYVRACRSDELAPGEVTRVETDPPIAVYNVEGDYYATDDTCTHEQWSLADGYVDGDQIECSWHFAKFCIRTGDVLSLPATKPLRTYQVILKDGDVYVEIDDGRTLPT